MSVLQFPMRLRCFDCGAPATIAIEAAETVPATLERADRGYCLVHWAQHCGGPRAEQAA